MGQSNETTNSAINGQRIEFDPTNDKDTAVVQYLRRRYVQVFRSHMRIDSVELYAKWCEYCKFHNLDTLSAAFYNDCGPFLDDLATVAGHTKPEPINKDVNTNVT